MKNILFIFTLLIAAQASAAMIPQVESVTIDGHTIIAPKTLKMLTFSAYNNGSTSATQSGFAPMGSSTPYAVPGGKSYRISAVKCVNGYATTAIAMTMGYDDAAIPIRDAATSFVNFVPIFPTSGGLQNFFQSNSSGSTVPIEFELGAGFVVPTGKYPVVTTGGSPYDVSCIVYGSEE